MAYVVLFPTVFDQSETAMLPCDPAYAAPPGFAVSGDSALRLAQPLTLAERGQGRIEKARGAWRASHHC